MLLVAIGMTGRRPAGAERPRDRTVSRPAQLASARPAAPRLEPSAGPARPGAAASPIAIAPVVAAPAEPPAALRAELRLPPAGPSAPPAPDPAVAPKPTAARASAVHEVRAGDSLWKLSGRYLGDPHRWPTIFEANRGRIGDPDLISPGQRLDIPAPR